MSTIYCIPPLPPLLVLLGLESRLLLVPLNDGTLADPEPGMSQSALSSQNKEVTVTVCFPQLTPRDPWGSRRIQ